MTFNAKLENELKRFLAEPDAYMDPGAYTSRGISPQEYVARAERILALMEYTNFAPEVMNHIVDYCLIEPATILNATGNSYTKVRMLEAVYLLNDDGGETTLCDYFLFAYTADSNVLDVDNTLWLVSKILSKFLEHRDTERSVFPAHIIDSFGQVLIDQADKIAECKESDNLVSILTMYWFMVNAPAGSVSSLLVQAMDKYAEIVYGTKAESIIQMAELLDMSGNVDYWKSALMHEPGTDYVLPSL